MDQLWGHPRVNLKNITGILLRHILTMEEVWLLHPVWYYIQEQVALDRKRSKSEKKVSSIAENIEQLWWYDVGLWFVCVFMSANIDLYNCITGKNFVLRNAWNACKTRKIKWRWQNLFLHPPVVKTGTTISVSHKTTCLTEKNSFGGTPTWVLKKCFSGVKNPVDSEFEIFNFPSTLCLRAHQTPFF